MHNFDISDRDREKLTALQNSKVNKVVFDAIELMKPQEVLVTDDTPADRDLIRRLAIERGEEKALATPGHTIHYDGLSDQARDKGSTAVLLPAGEKLSRGLYVVERDAGLKEIYSLMDGIMRDKTMIVRFYCLGPTKSRFAVKALQITDSFYVVHSEDLLYRGGYEEFRHAAYPDDFLYFWHSAGELDDRGCTKNVLKRRIYVDPLEYRVFSLNNQYAGNSIAAKKLALRLGIYKANHADWLAEHMFISAFSPLKGSRKTYFTGAYPSACGKTSTSMIPGASIVGDDIAYLRIDEEGICRAVNIEQGIFGIIKDVNAQDDPLIFDALRTQRQVIFSNVLTTPDGQTYWEGMGDNIQIPSSGYNHYGLWKKGDLDDKGKPIPISHPNSRFTFSLHELMNVDTALNDPKGVIVDGILYGGRDSDTTVPIAESKSWEHGVFVGATIESETTSATLGLEGLRTSNPMANMDFIIVPLGHYFQNHIKFGRRCKSPPKVFATNYFLRGPNGKYLNTKLDKKVWITWAEGRIHNEYSAIETPIGFIPKYQDLKDIFAQIFHGRIYSEQEYILQFTMHIDRYLAKYTRLEPLFREESIFPEELWQQMEKIRIGLQNLRYKFGQYDISPLEIQE